MKQIIIFLLIIVLLSAQSEFGINTNININPNTNSEESFSFLVNEDDYRSYDGVNNNQQHPQLGKKNSFVTSFGNNFENQKFTLKDLPNARKTSNILNRSDLKKPAKSDRSVLNSYWGMFSLADMFSTSTLQDRDKIDVKFTNATDSFLQDFTTIEQKRDQSMQYTRKDSAFVDNIRTTINIETSFIDASNIYGSDEANAKRLRTLINGELRSDLLTGCQKVLPLKDDVMIGDFKTILTSGNVNANEFPTLLSLHCLFVLEHNRLAKLILIKDPSLNDEITFQEARRVNIAQIQKITYYEWLPQMLGQFLPKYEVITLFKGYDGETDPRVENGFITAMKSLKSGLISTFSFLDQNLTTNKILLNQDFQFKGSLIDEINFEKYNFKKILLGALYQPQNIYSNFMEDFLRNNKASKQDQFFDDLMLTRDMGVLTINDIRQKQGLQKYISFDDFALINNVSKEILLIVKKLYENDINKLELLIGGCLEKKVQDGQIGETFQVLMAEQFIRSRKGDRMWFENQFKGESLDQIFKTTLTLLMHLNLEIPKNSLIPYAFDKNVEQQRLNLLSSTPTPINCGTLATFDQSLNQCVCLPNQHFISLSKTCKANFGYFFDTVVAGLNVLKCPSPCHGCTGPSFGIWCYTIEQGQFQTKS